MKLFIAEKPELGKAIASAIGVNQTREDSYIKAGNDIVTWAFGHILQLKDPAEYNEKWTKWTIDSLPIAINAADYSYFLPKSRLRQSIYSERVEL